MRLKCRVYNKNDKQWYNGEIEAKTTKRIFYPKKGAHTYIGEGLSLKDEAIKYIPTYRVTYTREQNGRVWEDCGLFEPKEIQIES